MKPPPLNALLVPAVFLLPILAASLWLATRAATVGQALAWFFFSLGLAFGVVFGRVVRRGPKGSQRAEYHAPIASAWFEEAVVATGAILSWILTVGAGGYLIVEALLG